MTCDIGPVIALDSVTSCQDLAPAHVWLAGRSPHRDRFCATLTHWHPAASSIVRALIYCGQGTGRAPSLVHRTAVQRQSAALPIKASRFYIFLNLLGQAYSLVLWSGMSSGSLLMASSSALSWCVYPAWIPALLCPVSFWRTSAWMSASASQLVKLCRRL